MASESEIPDDFFFSMYQSRWDECEAARGFNRTFLINPNSEWNIKPVKDSPLQQSSRSAQASAGISETRPVKLLPSE